MSVNAVGTSGAYTNYEAPEVKSVAADVKAADTKQAETGAVYEKSDAAVDTKKAPYSINKMSAEERASFVQKLKDQQAATEKSFLDIVTKTFQGQGNTFAIAMDSQEMWRKIASGDFTADAETIAQAKKDIADDGYWGVEQTAQRLFDFASALAGDDEGQMKKMQEAMEKGFKQAMGVWGKDLPELSNNTLKKANELFDNYYNSKKDTTAVVE